MTTVFSSDTWEFLDHLADDNSKATFDAERATYKNDVVAPSAALVDAMADLLPARVHPDLQGDAKVGRSLFRINRDTRFSKDPTPYKTHLDFLFWIDGEGPPRGRPACILRLTSSTVLLGAGQMGLKGASLDRYRSRVADDANGARLADIVDALTAQGAEISDADRVRVPKPYAADHPRAELLRRDGFHVRETHPHPAEIDTDGFADWCTDRLDPYGPLLGWLAP